MKSLKIPDRDYVALVEILSPIFESNHDFTKATNLTIKIIDIQRKRDLVTNALKEKQRLTIRQNDAAIMCTGS